MPHALRRLLLPLALLSTLSSRAQQPAAPSSTAAEQIIQVLQQSARDWNRGDLTAFADSYKHAPDILFIGKTISRGFDQMLATYRAHYGTPAAMGTLSFTQLAVQPLDAGPAARFATTTGRFHLERTAAGGGNADGYFLLVLERTPAGWKIVRDDTTALPN